MKVLETALFRCVFRRSGSDASTSGDVCNQIFRRERKRSAGWLRSVSPIPVLALLVACGPAQTAKPKTIATRPAAAPKAVAPVAAPTPPAAAQVIDPGPGNGAQAVADLLDRSIDCDGELKVSLQEFLKFSANQARSVGLIESYDIRDELFRGKQFVVVSQHDALANGRPLAPDLRDVDFYYRVDWPDVTFEQSMPATSEEDPLARFESHWAGACNEKWRQSGRSAEGASD
jgi:hypothetical protein